MEKTKIKNEKAHFVWIKKPHNQQHALIEKLKQYRTMYKFWYDFGKNSTDLNKSFEAQVNMESYSRLALQTQSKIEKMQDEVLSKNSFYYQLIHNVN